MMAMDSAATSPDFENGAARWETSAWSASVIVPALRALLPWVNSVIDVGCGNGAWLHEFELCGVERVLGLDRRALPPHLLEIEPTNFRQVDLAQPMKFDGQRFDLAMCLEVVGHLPKEMAEDFIGSLCRLSDVVLFSAPIPCQGTDSGSNERWPGYWVPLFEGRGYVCFDILRDRFWYDQRVEWYYAQNMLLFVRDIRREVIDSLRPQAPGRRPLDLVHPRCFEVFRNASNWTVAASLGTRMPASLRALASTLPREALLMRALAAEQRSATFSARLQAIEQSATWKVSARLREFARRHPFLRSLLRRCIKLVFGL